MFDINFKEDFWMNYSFTKQSEKSEKEIVNKTDFIHFSGDSNGF